MHLIYNGQESFILNDTIQLNILFTKDKNSITRNEIFQRLKNNLSVCLSIVPKTKAYSQLSFLPEEEYQQYLPSVSHHPALLHVRNHIFHCQNKVFLPSETGGEGYQAQTHP